MGRLEDAQWLHSEQRLWILIEQGRESWSVTRCGRYRSQQIARGAERYVSRGLETDNVQLLAERDCASRLRKQPRLTRTRISNDEGSNWTLATGDPLAKLGQRAELPLSSDERPVGSHAPPY
jgi:hypothetical protein